MKVQENSHELIDTSVSKKHFHSARNQTWVTPPKWVTINTKLYENAEKNFKKS